MEILKIRQKRVVKLKRKTNNVSGNRKFKEYIILFANKNKRITEEIIKSIKLDLLTPKGVTFGRLVKYFNIKILFKPNKTLTNKGILVRMGRGKGKLKTNALYLTTGTICVLLYPKDISSTNYNINYILKILRKFTQKYSFLDYKSLL